MDNERMFHVEQRRMDYHTHTLHSFDGQQSIAELCEAMLARGVQEVCLTEHIEPGHPDPACDLPPVWDVFFREVQLARSMYPMLTIRTGVEIGDNPAMHDKIIRDLDSLPLDFRLLSLHLVNGVDCYEADQFYAGKDRARAYREYA